MLNSGKPKIVFLLGSGISIPAGMPKLYEITERVLSGEDIYYDCDEEIFTSYKHPYPLSKIQEENVQRVVEFVHRLKVEIDYYYKKQNFRHETDYEDLYYVSAQIPGCIWGDVANPVVQSFIDKISPYVQPLLEEKGLMKEWRLVDLADKATEYIKFVVCYLLSKELTGVDYLSFIKDVCQDGQVSKVDIFTLNHDTVLEKYFEMNKINFTDGFFSPEGEEHRYWKPSLFRSRSFKVRFFKLHGSINWYPLGKDWSDYLIGIPSGMVNRQIKDSKGRTLYVLGEPIFIVGTYNKMIEYTRGIYQELRFQFYRSLRQVDKLVICGYGFGDEGINTEILEWIYSSPKNKLIVIDPQSKQLENRAKSPIRRRWNEWQRQNKLRVISRGIEEIWWELIRKGLIKST